MPIVVGITSDIFFTGLKGFCSIWYYCTWTVLVMRTGIVVPFRCGLGASLLGASLLFKDILNVCKSPCCLSLLRTSEERLGAAFLHKFVL